MILESQDDLVPTELVALGINLAANERCAQVLAEQGGLKFLLKRWLPPAGVAVLLFRPPISSFSHHIRSLPHRIVARAENVTQERSSRRTRC